MKAVEFKEVNVHIAKDQPEYEVLPVHAESDLESQGFFNRVTMCFELNEEERKQVAETGQIWYTILVPQSALFHPIMMSTLKPEMSSHKQAEEEK